MGALVDVILSERRFDNTYVFKQFGVSVFYATQYCISNRKEFKNLKPTTYVNRDEAILEIARGHRVLHLGCVGNTDLSSEQRVQLSQQSLHWKLSNQAEVVGVDYSAEVIGEYKRLGIFNNIFQGDVQRLEELNIKKKFDVVIAADIIEHLSNPGGMLDGIKHFCSKASRVVITTPHAFGLPNFIRFLRGSFTDGEEHVMTFNFDNIENLLVRHGYEIQRFDTCFQAHASSSKVLFPIGKRIFTTFPKLGGTILVVARIS